MKRFTIFFLGLTFLFACKNDVNKIPQFENFSQKPALTISKFESYYKSNSKLQLFIKAPIMEKYSEKNFILFKDGVNMIFFNENLDTIVNLKCEYAENYTNERLWKFAKNVVVVSQDGGILKTQELYFDQKKEKIYSLKIIELTDTMGNFLRGKGGFEANFSFTVYEFKNVDGIIKVPDEGKNEEPYF